MWVTQMNGWSSATSGLRPIPEVRCYDLSLPDSIEPEGPSLGPTHTHIRWKAEVATQKDRSSLDDPKEIAMHLIRDNGISRAQQIAVEGTTSANENGDFYRLSVWREVKHILQELAEPSVGPISE